MRNKQYRVQGMAKDNLAAAKFLIKRYAVVWCWELRGLQTKQRKQICSKSLEIFLNCGILQSIGKDCKQQQTFSSINQSTILPPNKNKH